MVEELLKEASSIEGALFVVGNEVAVSEIKGKPTLSFDQGWATIEIGCGCHLHLKLRTLHEARFIAEPGCTGAMSYSIRLFAGGEQPVFSIYLPEPEYLRLFKRFGSRDRLPL